MGAFLLFLLLWSNSIQEKYPHFKEIRMYEYKPYREISIFEIEYCADDFYIYDFQNLDPDFPINHIKSISLIATPIDPQ